MSILTFYYINLYACEQYIVYITLCINKSADFHSIADNYIKNREISHIDSVVRVFSCFDD